MDLLRGLNKPQKEAVAHHKGPLLILAGAGSGKTRVMAHRIAYLIQEKKIRPAHILGLSFTNKAAKELKERVFALLKKSNIQKPRTLIISTFHSLCVRILRKYATEIGFDSQFTIMDQSEQLEILKKILRHIKIDDRKFDAFSILSQISHAKGKGLEGAQAEEYFYSLSEKNYPTDYTIALLSTYPRYQDALKTMNAMDFDDLIFYTLKLLRENDIVRSELNQKFQYILVDEYQDTNTSQFELLSRLTQKQQNLCVVGDDDQSIYAWRGADSSHILNFTKYYPQSKVITLDQNYRSTQNILNAANQVIIKNKLRHPKSLWTAKPEGAPLIHLITEDDHDEAETVAEELLKRAQVTKNGEKQILKPWKDFAILFRSNPQSRLFEQALRMQNIPYRLVGAYSFLERKEVKDFLSYWRVILNPKDDTAYRRILNWPARGLGNNVIQKINQLALNNHLSLFEASQQMNDISPKAQQSLATFRSQILQTSQSLQALSPTALNLCHWAEGLLSTFQMQEGFRKDSDDEIQAVKKMENVKEVIHGLGQFKSESKSGAAILRDYVTQLFLNDKEEQDDKNNEKEKNENKVSLLTLHAAKGLEFPVVFLVGMEDGLLPHQRSIDEAQDLSEERRLCYVGLTRAQEELILTQTRHRIRYGKKVPRNMSRFLEDIPKELLLKEDRSGSPDLDSKEAQAEHESKVLGFLNSIRAQLEK